MRYSLLFIFLLLLSVESHAQSVCQGIKSNSSTADVRNSLLQETKKQLIEKANVSIKSIETAKLYLQNCNDKICREIEFHFLSALAEQIHISKILKVLSTGEHLYYEPVLKVEMMLKRNELIPDDVINFNLKGFTFSAKEKQQAFELWKQLFFHHLPEYEEHHTQPSGHFQHKINNFFNIASLELVNKNPLLPFIDESALTDRKSLFAGFDRLIQFNKEFTNIINSYKTHHKTGFWSYVNLAVADHEMGLVNFGTLIEDVIAKSDTSLRQQYCSAWNYLQSQQTLRVRTSIGVGFTTAVVCGVGVWSGIGTVPAAALCSFAVADGLWGAYMGKKTSNLGYYAMYAGKVLSLDSLNFSEGVMSYIDSKQLQNSGNVVFLINLIGLVPIAKSVITTVKGVRGTVSSLLVLPSADVTTSATEGASSKLIYVLLALKGLELNTDNLAEILAQL